jgi:hypothetical protein
VIDAKHRREFRLAMCSEPSSPKLHVQVVIDKPAEAPRLGLSFNGAWPVFECKETQTMLFPVGPYSEWTREHTAWEFVLDGSAIRDGFNTATVYNNSKISPVRVVSVEFGVRFA